ncbi:MAG: type I 3-dehydroquinate dehydratase [Deltaproteobacteria bacterium]|nr:type I 3-dehydroquinate dehydratase [Deltaproteobacteria bacterium]
MINYCLPIIEREAEFVRELIDRSRADYHFIEIWLDYIQELDPFFVEELAASLGSRLIFLFRRQGLDKIQMPLESRYRIIYKISESASFLDLDLTTQVEELDYIRREGLSPKLILSYHNYIETPDWPVLRKLAVTMRRNRATVCKVACMCNSPEDAVRLLTLQMEFRKNAVRHIVLGMGGYGAVTRIFGTLWGNEMIFAPSSHQSESAPGQLTQGELAQIFKILEGQNGRK